MPEYESLEDQHEDEGVYACEGLKAGEGCISGSIYGYCGNSNCDGVCLDAFGYCPCRCHVGNGLPPEPKVKP